LESAVYDPASAANMSEAEALVMVGHVRRWLKHHTPNFEQKVAKVTKKGADLPSSLPSRPSVQNGLEGSA